MTSRTDQTIRPTSRRDFTASAQHTLACLRRKFPNAFGGMEVVPLKIGIHTDILARTKLTEAEVVHFMTFYVQTEAYLRAQAQPGAMRHDLDGQAVESVSEANRIYASIRLDDMVHEQREHARFLAFRASLLESVNICGNNER